MTSPPLRVPTARQVARLIDDLKNRTDPSTMQTLTPPGWRLLAVVLIRCGGNMHDREFGGVPGEDLVVVWPSDIQGAPALELPCLVRSRMLTARHIWRASSAPAG